MIHRPLNLLTWLAVVIARCASQVSSAQHVQYVNYSAVDFDNQPGLYSPTLDYCLALATSNVNHNGAMYNAAQVKCVLLTTNNNEILVKLRANVGWTTFVKNISGLLKLVAKYQNALSSDLAQQNTYSIWTGTGGNYTSTYSAGVASVNVSTACGCHYRNAYIDSWNVSKVYIVVFHQSIPMSQIVFKAAGTPSTDWFVQSNVISTMPYVMQSIAFTDFTLFKLASQSCDVTSGLRSFVIMPTAYICESDSFYITLATPCYCTYMSGNYPWVIYSATMKPESINSRGLVQGDFFSVYIQVASRVTFV